MAIQKVGVLGCGLMGSGIAQVAAMAGYPTVVKEVADEFLKKGLAGIDKSLAKFVEKGTIPAEKRSETLGRLKGTTKFEDLADCDIVIEAITENVQVKRETYAALDSVVKKDAIFASNTSSLVITEMMTATKRVDRFIGMHFFNPVPLMKLVEVVSTITTAPAVMDEAMKFAASLGKVPIRTSDRSGFIVNRLLVPYLLDAIRVIRRAVVATKGSGALNVYIHAALNDPPTVLGQEISDVTVGKSPATNKTHSPVGIRTPSDGQRRKHRERALHVILGAYLHPCT